MTDQAGYGWLTFHRARLARACGPGEAGGRAPSGAAVWRAGADAPFGTDGFRTGVSDIWGGIGFYHDRAAAEAALASDDLPFASEAEEAWHGLLCVIAHRGEVDWSTVDEAHPALAPVERDPGGVMAVITSAGYASREEARHDQIRDFLRKVEQVRAFYGTLEANVVRMVFNPATVADGITFSVWRSDAGMLAAAYKDGAHRKYIDQHKAEAMFDRSSFTRLRLMASRGRWDGTDPLAEAA